jgi:hypothetical protein
MQVAYRMWTTSSDGMSRAQHITTVSRLLQIKIVADIGFAYDDEMAIKPNKRYVSRVIVTDYSIIICGVMQV